MLTVLLATVCGTTFGQDEEEEPLAGVAAAMMPQAQTYLQKSVDRELALLKTFTNANDATIAGINKLVKPLVKTSAKAAGADWMSFYMGYIPSSVLSGLETAAQKAIKDTDAFARYQDDLKARTAFNRRVSVSMFLSQLDSAVGIRFDQRKDIRKALEELAQKDGLPSGLTATGKPPSSAVQSRLKELLTKAQFAWWEKNRQHIQQSGIVVGGTGMAMEKRAASLKNALTSLAGAKIEWLRDEFKLNAKQTRKLQLAGKGAISKLIDKRLAAEDSVGQSLQDGAGGVRLDSEEAMLGMVHKEMLLSRYSRWRGLMLGTLTDEQAMAFRKLEKERAKAERESLIDQCVLGMGRELPLTAKQMTAFRSIFDKLTPPADPEKRTAPYTAYQKVLTLPKEDFVAAIGEDNWQKLQPTLQMMKQSYGGEAAGEEPADEAKK